MTLRLTAFGSYAGSESVDFTRLAVHGLFVVSGPTGSGKTTLFDAMAYALYGSLPGDRPDDVRSHHAAAGVRTEVELVFEAEGHRYRVTRTPRHDRPKKTGQGNISVAATAELYEVSVAGDIGLASGVRDVGLLCTELVGLSVEQFQRVVLLPQGKCAQFLLCRTDERQSLLQQLFGSQLYARATRAAMDHAGDLGRALNERDAEAERHRLNAFDSLVAVAGGVLADAEGAARDALAELDPTLDLDAIDALITAAEVPLGRQHIELGELAERARVAAAAYANAAATARLFDERERGLATLEWLETQRASIDSARRRAGAARRAGPVLITQRRVDDLHREQAIDEASVRVARDKVVAALRDLGIEQEPQGAVAAAVLVDRCEARVTAAEQQLAALAVADAHAVHLNRTSVESTEAVESLDQALSAVGIELMGCTEQLVGHQVTAATAEGCRRDAASSAQLVQRQADQQRDEAALVEARADAGAARLERARVTAAFVADAAPRLAAQLAPGEPCPVCGSPEHPAPAVSHGAEHIDREVFDAAIEASRQADLIEERLAVRLAEHRRELGEWADVAPETLLQQHGTDVARLHQAEAAEAAVTQLRARMEQLQTQTDGLIAQRQPLIRAAADASAAAVLAEQQLAEMRLGLGGLDAVVLAAQRSLLGGAASGVRRWTDLEESCSARDGAIALAVSQRDAALIDSGYPDAAAATADALPDDDIARFDVSVGAWDRDHAEVTTQLEALVSADLPPVRPQTDELCRVADGLEADQRALSNRVAELDLRLADARVSLKLSRAVFNDSEALRLARRTADRVATMCAGKNQLNVALETWVLAGELERVTAAANVHLARMTRGRYALERSDGADDRRRRGGLDLMVLDADTGRPRSPGTLSGGEQFQASLALALGLADVVSQGGSGSGRVFEALFVDEGFGSLDPQALDEAIDALHELHATGRMVGVITHVEAMKQQLPIGIEVIARDDGAGSNLLQP